MKDHSQNAACWLYENKIKNGIFYCHTELLPYLTTTVGLTPETILVIGDGDCVYEKDIPNIDFKYAIVNSLCIDNSKYKPMPTGLRIESIAAEKIMYEMLNRKYKPKTKNVFVNFSTATNSNRRNIFELCKKLNLTNYPDVVRMNEQTYFTHLNEHFFTVSPPSNGIDNSRTWEALYAHSIPIVQNSVTARFYNKIFPMIIVDDWAELEKYKFDHNLYYETMSKYPNYTDYLDARNLWSYILNDKSN